MTSAHAPGQGGAFFGRRKGHRLRPHHAELMATLLPRLALRSISRRRAIYAISSRGR